MLPAFPRDREISLADDVVPQVMLVEKSVQSKKVIECEEGKGRELLEAKGYRDSTRRLVAMVKCGETPCAPLSRIIAAPHRFQAGRRS